MIAIGIYAGVVGWLEVEYWKLSDASYIKNITLMHGMLGFVISLLLVFRTNTAYDRWWEGRRLWGAHEVIGNASRGRQAVFQENDSELRPCPSRALE